MQKLVLVRHGHRVYPEDRLSDWGERQMRNMGSELFKQFGEQSIAMISSAAMRAQRSAALLCEALGESIKPQVYAVLWSDNMHPVQPREALDLILKVIPTADVLVVVTHMEYCSIIPQKIGAKLGVELIPRGADDLQIGNARVIDLEKKTCVEIGNYQN